MRCNGLGIAMRVLGFAVACFSGTAFADWQGTVWNSAPAQADKDFRVPHRAATSAEHQNYFNRALLAFDNYEVGDLTFSGVLLFDDGKLRGISMKLKQPWQCDKLISVLEARYGKPAKDKSVGEQPYPKRYVTWYDQKERNEVDVNYSKYPPDTDDDCYLQYEPFIVPSPGQLYNRCRYWAAILSP